MSERKSEGIMTPSIRTPKSPGLLKLEIDLEDFPRAIEAMRQAFIDDYPEPADDVEQACIMDLADKFVVLAKEYLLPIHESLLTKFIAARASNTTPDPRTNKPRPTAHPPAKRILSEIPPTSKQLHAHTVWQKARVHGLIPADSVYRTMCPDEASKKRFYDQYVLKIIAIDEGAAKAVLDNIKQNTDAEVFNTPASEPTLPVRRVKSLNHMQLFRRDFCQNNPNASVSEIRNAWAKLSAKEQQAYMIKATQP